MTEAANRPCRPAANARRRLFFLCPDALRVLLHRKKRFTAPRRGAI